MSYKAQMIKQIVQDKASKKKCIDLINKKKRTSKSTTEEVNNLVDFEKGSSSENLTDKSISPAEPLSADLTIELQNQISEMQKQIDNLNQNQKNMIKVINNLTNELNLIKTKIIR